MSSECIQCYWLIITSTGYRLTQEEFEDTKGGNQNPYIKEEQTTQWPKEKVQKDRQRSKKHTHKTKDRVTRTPLKTGDELVLRKGRQFLPH
jgi:hypothetical protein